jgi:hypothetical protein
MIRVLKMFLPLLALILFASGCASTGQVKTTKQALPMSCEKFITFAMAENGSLVPKPPNVSDKWWKKMQNKYRNVCFEGMGSPTSTSVHYLVVLSESDSAFNGLYPVFRTETDTSITPISGSGTITDYTGSRWYYSYQGTLTTTTTTTTQTDVPYTDTTYGAFANAYNTDGRLVASDRKNVTYRTGGDPANSMGYNIASRLFSGDPSKKVVESMLKQLSVMQ